MNQCKHIYHYILYISESTALILYGVKTEDVVFERRVNIISKAARGYRELNKEFNIEKKLKPVTF